MRKFYKMRLNYIHVLLLLISCFVFNSKISAQCLTVANGTAIEIQLGPGECEADTNRILLELGADLACSFDFDGAGPRAPFVIGGPYDVTIDWDSGGPSGSNTHQITVKEFAGQTNVLACNNQVQISLDEKCIIPVDADMILEGNNYGCYEDFKIDLRHIEGDSMIADNVILAPGTYGVTVTNDEATNNKCWGTIIAEDKLPPEIWCSDQVIPCVNSNFPGDTIFQRYKVEGFHSPASSLLNNVTTTTYQLAFPVNYTVEKVEIFVDIDSKDISSLSANLKAPSGEKAVLFDRPFLDYDDEHCTKEGLMTNFFDDAPNPNAVLDDGSICRVLANPSVFAEISPKDTFGIEFKGIPSGGNWTLEIADSNSVNPFTLDGVILRITVAEDVVSFPVHVPTKDFVWDPVNERFEVKGLAICDAKYAEFEDEVVEKCDVIDPMDTSNPFAGTKYYKHIKRDWTVTDASGNESYCTQWLFLESGELETPKDHIECPPNFDDLEMPSFRCPDEYAGQALPNGAPSPEVTGYPFDYRTPDHTLCPNIQVTFDDLIIPICANSFKVVRNWTILDWCTGVVRDNCTQVIKVVDNLEPWVDPVQDTIMVFMDNYPYQCGADFKVPAPIVSMECNEVKWRVAYKAHEDDEYIDAPGEADLDGNITIADLPIGFTWVKYIVEDACGNINDGRAEIVVQVKDNVPPVPVCDESTTVSVGIDGKAVLHAGSIDDGSWDNCGIDYFEVAKMTDKCHDPKDENYQAGIFLDKVYFCCAEIGDTLMVTMRAYDHYGNHNDCMVEVWVQDKIPPYLKCPDDLTLECQVNYEDLDITGTPEYLDNCQVNEPEYTDITDLDQCGTGWIEREWSVTDVAGFRVYCIQNIHMYDYDPFEMEDRDFPKDIELETCGANADPGVTGEPWLNDDDKCSLVAATYEDLEFSFVDGACKKIIREWTVIDWCQYQQEDHCIIPEQINSSYECPEDDEPVCGCNGITYDNACEAEYYGGVKEWIAGPCNTECKSPLNLTEIFDRWGAYTFDTELHEINYEGKYYYVLFDTLNCKDLLDPWTLNSDTLVYDCTGALLGTYGLDADDLDGERFLPWYPDVLPQGKVVWDCYGIPEVTNEGMTGTRGLWRKTQIIKINNVEAPVFDNDCDDVTICSYGPGCGGEIDLKASATDECTPEDQLVWHWSIYEFGEGFPYAPSSTGHSTDASGYYPDGEHRIVWKVEDQCGNVSICDYTFTVVDCKEPVPYCLTSITTVVMPSNGQVEVWAVDFDYGSADNCTPDNKLRFSFSEDVNDLSIMFTCADIPNGQRQTIPVEMWVTDLEGNQDFCQVELELQDNAGDYCEDVEVVTASVSGAIITEDNKQLRDVEVTVATNHPEFPRTSLTNNQGAYSFVNLPLNYNYSLDATKNDADVNGVSTLDLVLIQKHILGLGDLNSPYKVLAADADKNRRVTAADLIHLRKLILGITEELPNNQKGWRFIDNTSGNTTTDPFSMVEGIELLNLDSYLTGQNMIAIKTGDVNGNVKVNGYEDTEIRNNVTLNLVMTETDVQNGMIEIPVSAGNFNDILGFQYTLDFDVTGMKYHSFKSGALGMENNNFGLRYLPEGKLSMSWNTVDGYSANESEVLFTLVFEKLNSRSIADQIQMSSVVTAAEAYGMDYKVMNVNLDFRNDINGELLSEFELLQNTPNPFSEYTVVGFKLPKASKAVITVYDVTGKVLHRVENRFEQGYNELTLSKSELNASGVLYYSLETEGFTATKKMIGID